MDAYKLCSADKDLNPNTCKFSLKCKPGMERDEKFLCKKSANPQKAKESLQNRLNSYLKTGLNKTLRINIGQLKRKLETKNGGKNGQGITNSLNRMLEQIREHQEKNPSKRTQKRKPKTENRMVVRDQSRNSSIYYVPSSRSRSGSTINSPYSVNLNSVGSVNGQKAHREKGRKPVGKAGGKYMNTKGNPLGIKL